MAKKILPGDMPNKTGTKRNGGAIPGRPAPKSPSGPKRTPTIPGRRTAPVKPIKPKVGPIDSTRTGSPKTAVGTDVGTPETPVTSKPAPDVPAPNPKGQPKKPNPAYRSLKNALNTPGMQAGEKEAQARVMKNRGVTAKEARRIMKRRTAKGLPTARISRSA